MIIQLFDRTQLNFYYLDKNFSAKLKTQNAQRPLFLWKIEYISHSKFHVLNFVTQSTSILGKRPYFIYQFPLTKWPMVCECEPYTHFILESPPASPGSSYLLKASAMRQSQRSVLQSVDIIVAMETDWIDAVAKQFLLVAGH